MPDLVVSNWVHAHRHPAVTGLMLLITQWHSLPGVALMSAGVAVLLYRRHQTESLWLLLLCVPGIMLLNAVLKLIFQRARPAFDDPLMTLATYSFPSGHTAAATVFYGFIAMLVLDGWRDRSAGWRGATVAVAVLMVSLVAASRVYLGVHYLSDVLGAVLEGLLWLALCVALRRVIRTCPGRAAP